ncbi:putative fatty acyl-CoA reductase CG5065 [Uranotaenia lowii]|uniref:putative fatty acyl-CoA reductase CG5065 n=1 Tax=Uranotaenia lowii TaxID=190385 RepID=UPI0024795D81|nr:putative fatty acyl-CoA reductase CG5065 [Uranotaenia lowii]
MGDFRTLPINSLEGRSDVSDFYRNSVVLITGGSGFIGKVLIEKLLRCFEVRKIYLLMRKKGNDSVEDRMRKIFQEPIFNSVKQNHRNICALFSKVIPIDTDFDQDQPVSEKDQQLLLPEVNIVFNVLASVKFNEQIESALFTNVICSRTLFELASQMPNLKSIVHVSTFYSNCDRPCIEEVIHQDIPFGGYENILNIFEQLNDSEKDQLTPMILRKMPNSYTFSKKCAEIMIQKKYNELPVAIFRPPVVLSAYREPIPGWIDNFNGVAGMCIPILRKKFYCARSLPGNPSHSVPVDFCVAAMIAVGAEIRKETELPGQSRSVPVYNYATDRNNVLWEEYSKLAASGLDTRVGRFLGQYTIINTNSSIFRQIFVWLFLLQALVADLISGFTGKKQRNLSLAKRVLALEEAACYFGLNRWTVRNDNMRRVWEQMSDRDRKALDFNIDRLDWRDYFKTYIGGVRDALTRRKLRKD